MYDACGLLVPDKFMAQGIIKGRGVFDRASYDLAMSHCENFKCAVDIGAHVGSWSRAMQAVFEDVYAFEPDDLNYSCLEKNTQTAKLCKVALGDSHKSHDIKNVGNSGQAHLTDGYEIKTHLLDDYDLAPDFVKIDVEGYEFFTITGGLKTLKKHKPVLCVELNGLSERYGRSDDDVIELLNSLNYEIVGMQNKDYIFK